MDYLSNRVENAVNMKMLWVLLGVVLLMLLLLLSHNLLHQDLEPNLMKLKVLGNSSKVQKYSHNI